MAADEDGSDWKVWQGEPQPPIFTLKRECDAFNADVRAPQPAPPRAIPLISPRVAPKMQDAVYVCVRVLRAGPVKSLEICIARSA